MSQRIFDVPVFTPTATADTVAAANATYMAIIAGTALRNVLVSEIFVGGASLTSTINTMLFARSSTLGITPTALAAPASDGFKNNFAAAQTTGATTYTAAATGPQRSATTTNPRINLTHNALGGICKWQSPGPGYEWGIFGVTADLSESMLSCLTNGGGAVGAHIVYEVI